MQAWLGTGQCEDKIGRGSASGKGKLRVKNSLFTRTSSPPRNCAEFRIRRKINLTLRYAGHFGGSLHHDKGGRVDGL